MSNTQLSRMSTKMLLKGILIITAANRNERDCEGLRSTSTQTSWSWEITFHNVLMTSAGLIWAQTNPKKGEK